MTSTPGAADARLEVHGRIVRRTRLAASVGHALDAGSVIITAGAGSGKTTILEQALEGRAVAWLSCSESEREPGALLMRLIAAIADAIPGAADAFAEQLASGRDSVDPTAATRELIAELSLDRAGWGWDQAASGAACAAPRPSARARSAPKRAAGSSGTGTAIVRSRHW
jgi:hypothetical protein